MLKISETHFNNFVQWGKDRNIFNGSTVNTQVMKSLSECGELCDHIAKGKYELCEDDIGDIAVTLVMIAGCAKFARVLKRDVILTNDGPCEIEASAATVVTCVSSLLFAFTGRDNESYIEYLFDKSIAALIALTGHMTAKGHPMTLDSCCAKAWDDIKDRKGVMFNGTFIKESDPLYASCLAELKLS